MRKKYQLHNLIPDQKEKDESHISSSLQGHITTLVYKIIIIQRHHKQRPSSLVGHPSLIAMPRVRIPAALCASFFSKLLKHEILVYKQDNTIHHHNPRCRAVGRACASYLEDQSSMPYQLMFFYFSKSKQVYQYIKDNTTYISI